MSTFLIVTQFILGILIVRVVLLQKTSSMGFGSYSGSNESLFGAKGPTSFLAKATMFLGALFLANTLGLGYFYNSEKNSSVIDTLKLDKKEPTAPSAPNTPTAPTVPTVPSASPESVPVAPQAPKTN